LTPKRKIWCLRLLNGVEEDAAESDLGAALVTEGVVDDQPDRRTWDEIAEQLDEEDAGDVVPVPDGSIEEPIGAGVVGVGRLAGGLPDPGEGAPAQAGDPGYHEQREGGMHGLVETARKGGEQDDQRCGNLEHERTS